MAQLLLLLPEGADRARRGRLSKHRDMSVVLCTLLQAMPAVETADLIDARRVAGLLGLSHPNSVSTYQRRYADMPRPVVNLGEGRCKLWLESEIRRWVDGRRAEGAADVS